MNAVNIYYYTAWNGYSWQGCDEATAASLQRYMEAAGVLPGGPGREPPFGGAIACQVGDRMGVAVYRCGIRAKGDAFGRDSFFIALAFVPLEVGPVDFAAIMSLSQMSPSAKGELSPVSVSLSGLRALPSGARHNATWRDESFSMHFNDITGLRDASALFFQKACQLGLLQATFLSDTGSLAGVTVSVSYRVFPEVAALAEASRAYADAKKLSRGALSAEHPVSMKLWDAVNQLQTRRIDKMPDYTGLAEYLAARDAELGDVIARAQAYVRRQPVQQSSASVAAATSPHSASCAKRNNRPRSERQSWVMYVLVAICIVLVVVFAAWAIATYFSTLKTKQDIEVQRLENKIRALESECDQAKERGKEDLDNQVTKLNSEINKLRSSWNSEINSNKVLLAEIDKVNDKLAKADEDCKRLTEHAESIRCKISKKRIEDAWSTVMILSEIAKRFPEAEIANVWSEKTKIGDDYKKNRDKIIADEARQDAFIKQCKNVAKAYIDAFKKEYDCKLNKEADLGRKLAAVEYANKRLQENKRPQEQLERTHSNSPRVSLSPNTPARYKYNVKDEDGELHNSGVFTVCKCWRCEKARQIRQVADKEVMKLKSDAEQLNKTLDNLIQARKGAEDAGAASYAKLDYDIANTKYMEAHANDIEGYIQRLNNAKELFEKAKAKAEETKNKQENGKANKQTEKVEKQQK